MTEDRTRIGSGGAPPPPRAAAPDAGGVTVIRAAPPRPEAPPFAPDATRVGRPSYQAIPMPEAPTLQPHTGDSEQPVVRKTSVEIGEVLGHTYQIDAFLARGGMGAVYRAKHQILESEHAIKLILPELSSDPQIIGLMKQEAKALRKVKNDAIVEYQGLFLDEFKRRYLVMEFVDGPSLATILRDKRLSPADVRTLRDRLALGLAAAHDKGIFHRDLSPDNIIVPGSKIENAKIIDFGIAKSVEPGEKSFLDEEFAGKYSYVSPEQAGLFGGKIDGRSDIYSLGLVLAAAAIGFGGKLDMGNSPETVNAAREHVPDLKGLPAELRDEIARLLQPEPDKRPAGMRDIVSNEALLAAGEGGVIAAPALDLKRLFLVVGAVVVVLGGLGGAHVANPRLLGSVVTRSPADVVAEVRKAFADLRCTTLIVDVQQDYLLRYAVRISGFAPTPEDVKRMNVDIAGLRNIGKFENAVQVVEWPFCDVLNLVHTMTGGAADPDRAPVVNALGRPEPVFRDGEAMRLQVTAAKAFDGYLYVDLVDSEGNIIHMLPTQKRPDNAVKAGDLVTIGAAKGASLAQDTLYEVGPPFGTNLILATSTAKPLWDKPRPQVEQAADYLDALRTALRGAGQPMSYYRYIETAPVQ